MARQEATSCSSLKGQVQESDAENPGELPDRLGALLAGAPGPKGSTRVCRRKGGHTNNQTLVPSGNSQGDSKMPRQLEAETDPVLREWPGRRKLSVSDGGETPGENPPCVVTCGAWAVWCRVQLLPMDKEHGGSPSSTAEPADRFRTLRDVYQLGTHTLSSPRKLGGGDRSLGQTTAWRTRR